ncbi:MAG: nitrous oxide reductase accessory protein NosL [bacterium]
MLTALAALLVLGTFFVPLWRIQLHAPQYPEGLGMLIRLNTITGMKPPDLDNINGLNHYIGMKTIDPTAIPVLTVMPWVAGGLALVALLAALTGVRVLLAGWLAAFALAGAAGMFEFYRWSYDYGHNLAPDAIIKVPGMTYQPPLIGSKALLNFVADSWPATGGWLAAAAFVLGALALWLGRRSSAGVAATRSGVRGAAPVVAVMLVAALLGCTTNDPAPIAYGRADCDVCRMRITDQRFGGELVSQTGKVHQFDSIECLANYTAASSSPPRSLWVSDFEHPGTLLPVSRARFIRRAGPSAGMGANLLAVAATTDTTALRAKFGEVTAMSWDDIRALAVRGALRERFGDA